LDLYSQLLDAAHACLDEALRIEENPVDVPDDLRDDETPPLPPSAIRADEQMAVVMRRIELAAPRHVVSLAGDLSFHSLQIMGYAVDRPARARRQDLREYYAGWAGAPQVGSESELADRTYQAFSDAREAFVRAARADLGVSDEDLP
jgi:hypothetical protein